jgi:hypothetical protein
MSFAPPSSRAPALAPLSVAEDSTLEEWIRCGGTMTLEEFAAAGGIDVEAFRADIQRSLECPGRPLLLAYRSLKALGRAFAPPGE